MNMDAVSKWERLTTELDKAFNDPEDSPDDEGLANINATDAATEKQSPNVEITNGCSHPCPLELQSKPGSRKLCPPCLIDDHITDIRSIKIAFESRGGIFSSKTHLGGPFDLRHKDYVRMWTVAKIECYRDVELLEKLRNDDPEQAKELGVLEGLERWEQAREELCRVLGYKYVDDQTADLDSETEPGGESEPEPMPESALVGCGEPDVEVGTSRPATAEEMEALLAEGREYRVVASKLKKKKRRNVNLTVSTGSEINHKSTTPPGDLASLDDEVLQEMEGVTQRLDQRLSMGKWDFFDAITDSESEAVQDSASRSDSPPMPSLTPNTPKTVVLPNTPTQRSALKGTRSTPLDFSRIAFPTNKSILTLESFPSIEEAHSKHTNAEDARMRGDYHRTSPWYRKGSWASSDEFEKEDTSFMRMTWFRYEKYVRVPPPVNAKKAWLKDPSFSSLIADSINKVWDRRLEEDITDTKDEAQVDTQETGIADALSQLQHKDAEQDVADLVASRRSLPRTSNKLKINKPDRWVKGRSTHQPAWKRFEKFEQTGPDKPEDYTGPKDTSQTPEQLQLILHPTARNEIDTSDSPSMPASDNREEQMYASMQEHTWPPPMSLRPSPYQILAPDEKKTPNSPKPVHRDLRRSSKKPLITGLTFGVGERESER
jgi:hypothetical protein